MKVPRERFDEVSQTWGRLPERMRKCPDCGKVLDGPVRDAWPENKEEAWAYVSCPRCGEIALWKIVKRWESGRDAGTEGGDTRR